VWIDDRLKATPTCRGRYYTPKLKKNKNKIEKKWGKNEKRKKKELRKM